MLLNIKFSVTRSVEVAYLTAVIMSGLDPKNKKWMAGLVLGQVVLFHGFILLVVMLICDHTDHTTYHDHNLVSNIECSW